MVEEVRRQLKEAVDENYRIFNQSLVPGETTPMLGVRIPRLRALAKEIAKKDGRAYIRDIRQQEELKNVYHEELLLHGMVIGYLKCENQERELLLDGFVPVIDNWAVCDSSCMTYKFMKKDMEQWFSYLLKYVNSEREYEIRFAVVSMLDHFVTEAFIDRILEKMDEIRHEGYYVKMAVAWALSVCYVKFQEKTKRFLEKNHLDDFTQNKTIQKIRESYRVSREEKEMLKELKR